MVIIKIQSIIPIIITITMIIKKTEIIMIITIIKILIGFKLMEIINQPIVVLFLLVINFYEFEMNLFNAKLYFDGFCKFLLVVMANLDRIINY